jgi:hypothetical protein
VAYVPQFDFDIFISYRHASNEGEDPWIDAFCNQLHQLLAELTGDISIWRDTPALRAGDQWRPEIAQTLDSVAIFLAIISRTYFDSDICRNELDRFLGQQRKEGATRRIRIVPIFKQPPKPGQDLPRELAEIHHHEFYEYYDQTPPGPRRFREYSPGRSATATQFLETLSRVAQDIGFVLDELRDNARRQTVGTVFVASVGPELAADRAKLRADLQQRRYLVLPESEYFWNAGEFHERITEDLAAAELCIHLVTRGASIEEETAKRARLQLDLAITAMQQHRKPMPLVWMQPAAATAEEAKPLIDYIERDAANQGVEYSPGALEDFKTQIYDRLEHLARKPAAAQSASRDVGLVFVEGDLQAIDPLLLFLADTLGVGVRRIKCPGSGPLSPEPLAAAVARCDRTIVFWGSQSEDWISDLLSLDAVAASVGRDRCCVVAGGMASPEKETYRTGKAATLSLTSPVWDQQLRAFLEGGRKP